MKKAIAALCVLAGLISSLSQAATLTLTQPLTRAVFQRNNQNTAMIPIAGTYTDLPSQIEACAVVMNGFTGTPTDWQVIVPAPTGGSFSATLPVEAGGWYSIQVRMVIDGRSYTATVDRIGVGEVFITAGQSNSANYGSPAKTPAYDTVSAWTGSAWRQAYDPQPIANGTAGGSPWSRLADMLANTFDVPIGFISVGVGGTRVERWVPSANDLYPRLQGAIAATGSNGMRAILWHQGESDAQGTPTPTQTYAARLTAIINQSRIDAGRQVPWGIALAAWMPTNQEEAWRLAVRQGQLNVINTVADVFQGPDTDIWTGTTYRVDTVHFNALGLQLHAAGWLQAILKYMYPWDMDQDQDVDLTDFSAMSSHWLEPYPPGAAWWKLDETAGLSATDSSGNNRDGTLINGPAWAAGKIGGAISLDGVDDYIEIPGYTGILGTSSRTCSAWIKTSGSSTNTVIMDWGAAASGQKWLFGLFSTGELVLYTWTPYIKTNMIVADNQWHHVAAVLTNDGTPDVSEIKLYVDGLLQATAVGSTQAINTVSAANVLLGAYDSAGTKAGYFNGLIDDVRIYDTALSDAQIAEVFRTTGDFDKNHTVDTADLFMFCSHWQENYKPNEARWKFDETAGTTAGDSTGNNHNGTLINGPVWTAGKIGGAISLDGIDDYIEIPDYKGILGTLSRTSSAWIKTGGSLTANTVIVDWGAAAAGQKWLFGIFTTGELVIYTSPSYIKTNRTVTDNQWHHVAAVLADDGTPDVSKVKLYVDGLLQATTGGPAQAINTISAANVLIGAFDSAGTRTGYFNGLIDDVRIYSAALSLGQIMDIASQP